MTIPFVLVLLLNSCYRVTNSGDLPDILSNHPKGLKVVVSPEIVYANYDKTKQIYFWSFNTTIESSVDQPVKIIEFGKYVRHKEKWYINNNNSEKPLGSEQFANQFKCENATLRNGVSYGYEDQSISSNKLSGNEVNVIFYFIGETENGDRVTGYDQFLVIERTN